LPWVVGELEGIVQTSKHPFYLVDAKVYLAHGELPHILWDRWRYVIKNLPLFLFLLIRNVLHKPKFVLLKPNLGLIF
jgi:hypothetical protein